jgi:hypothetical protein
MYYSLIYASISEVVSSFQVVKLERYTHFPNLQRVLRLSLISSLIRPAYSYLTVSLFN